VSTSSGSPGSGARRTSPSPGTGCPPSADIAASSARTLSSTPGRFFFMKDRRGKHVQRPRGKKLLDAVTDHLRRQIVEVGFQHPTWSPGAGGPCIVRQTGAASSACSTNSRRPAPWPMRSMVNAGCSIHSFTMVVRMAAPVGVVSSAFTVLGRSGTPLSSAAVPAPAPASGRGRI